MRTEEYRTDRDGERESYNPPRYSYSYDYYFYIYLNHPYIHEMKLKLNSMDISEDDRNRRHDVERAGQEMMSYLQNVTGCTVGGMGMNQGMGMQPGMGMNNQGMGMQPAMGMNQGMGMQPAMGMNNQGMGMQPGMGMNNQGMGMQPAAGMNQGMSQNVNPQGGMGTATGGMELQQEPLREQPLQEMLLKAHGYASHAEQPMPADFVKAVVVQENRSEN